MEKTISIKITIDSESAYVFALETLTGNGRTVFLTDGADKPISINEAIDLVRDEINDLLD